jgi:hypothetical protein
MVSSGMKVPIEVEEAGKAVMSGKTSSGVVINLDSKTNTLSVGKTYNNKMKHPYRACLAQFQDDKASFALVNVKLSTGEGQDRDKLVLVMWAPDTATAKVKMTAASGSRALRSKFKYNAYVEIQEKTPGKNVNDVLSKVLRSGEGCTSIEGVNVTQNELREFVFSDGGNHDDSDFDEED